MPPIVRPVTQPTALAAFSVFPHLSLYRQPVSNHALIIPTSSILLAIIALYTALDALQPQNAYNATLLQCYTKDHAISTVLQGPYQLMGDASLILASSMDHPTNANNVPLLIFCSKH